jgi:hypothetical protein
MVGGNDNTSNIAIGSTIMPMTKEQRATIQNAIK